MTGKEKGFLIYYDNEIVIRRLSDQEAGQLFKSLFPYATEHIKPEFDDNPALAMAFDVLSMTIDRNMAWYKEKCEKNKQNIMKRWEKKNTNVYERIESNTNVYERLPNKEKEKDKEKNNNNNKEKEKEKDKEKDSIYYQQIADMYNETCVSFPKCTKLSDARKKAIKARLNVYTLEEIQEAFRKAESSSFLKGGNDRDWRADFDWIMKDANMAKILDGRYDNREPEIKHEILHPEFIGY